MRNSTEKQTFFLLCVNSACLFWDGSQFHRWTITLGFSVSLKSDELSVLSQLTRNIQKHKQLDIWYSGSWWFYKIFFEMYLKQQVILVLTVKNNKALTQRLLERKSNLVKRVCYLKFESGFELGLYISTTGYTQPLNNFLVQVCWAVQTETYVTHLQKCTTTMRIRRTAGNVLFWTYRMSLECCERTSIQM